MSLREQCRRFQGVLATRLLVLGLVAATSACGASDALPDRSEPQQQPFARATRVETVVVMPRSFDENIQVTGAVEALNDATLAAEAAGSVDYIANRGDRVEKGAVVAQLDQSQALAGMLQAEAQMQTAQAQRSLALDSRDRLLPLQDRKVISAREFEQARLQLEQAEASVRQAEAALATAQVQLDNTVIRAPFGGTVEQKFLDLGERAGPGDPVVRLVSIDEMRIIAGVPERYASDLEPGMSVQVSFPSANLQPRTGELTFVGAAIDPLSRTFPIEVRTPNPNADLKPMMLAELRVARNRYADVLTLPRSAVVPDERGPGVYVVERGPEGAVARRRPVVLGADAVGFVIIASGLNAGDEVVILGQHSISDGDAVDAGGRD